uniref:Uncharacterized protein n=1 Tax=Timema monikensis TaxID=170555 RepID=A0A7R9HM58_9NEOP|nr:unnamed protein product [Timema monikensis]
MKKFTFKGVLDGFRSSVSQQARADQEIIESLRPDNFQVAKLGGKTHHGSDVKFHISQLGVKAHHGSDIKTHISQPSVKAHRELMTNLRYLDEQTQDLRFPRSISTNTLMARVLPRDMDLFFKLSSQSLKGVGRKVGLPGIESTDALAVPVLA